MVYDKAVTIIPIFVNSVSYQIFILSAKLHKKNYESESNGMARSVTVVATCLPLVLLGWTASYG